MATLLPLSNYLRTHRKRSGLAQHELAELLGSKNGSKVSRYERGERNPSFATLIACEIIFGIPLTELFRGEATRIRTEVRHRAQRLSRKVDARKPFTPSVKRKFDFLADIINPPRSRKA